MVPAPDLPSGVVAQRSNNNLALALHDGRLFFAFFRGGVNPAAFEPGPTLVAKRLGPGLWSEPAPLFPEEGWVAWRVKMEDGTPYMLRYRGGHYRFGAEAKPLEVEFLTSRDGLNWTPVDPRRPVVYRGGGSEADFGLDSRGDLYATIRIEDADPGGMGARTCRAPAGDLANWSCVADPRRCDSPLAFSHNGSVYLVARRHPLGNFDLGLQALPPDLQFLPYNYSSDPEGCEVPWLVGQLGPTYIYATRLKFERDDTGR